MDPQQPINYGHELPALPKQGDSMPNSPANTEYMPASPEVAPVPAQPAPAQPVAQNLTPQVQSASTAQPVSDPVGATTNHPTSPTVADDLDLIEKEWVTKAKAIVAKTRNDPYMQNKEMNKFKADYLSKRYNKEIKIEP